MNILIGADPEVFVKQGRDFKSAHGLIRGDKKNPFKVRNGAVQVDGMALEFNINPASTEDEFCINIQDVYAQLCAMVPEYNVVPVPVAHFNKKYLESQPEEALELGCDPDYNGWTLVANDRPNADRPMRTASGHVHIGWTDGENVEDNNHVARCGMVARQMDFFLGLPSLFYDKDKERREMYGKSGAFRPKPYGAEYRTLSNAWLNSESLTRWVFRAAKRGMEELMAGNLLFEKHGDIQAIINNSDIEQAKRIIEQERLEVCLA